MKKLLSLLLCAALLLCGAVNVFAASCSHSYNSEVHAVTCVSREKTVYTCSLCGYSYETVSEPGYTAPSSLYTLLRGELDGDTLTLSVYLYNNPGLYAEKITLYFNEAALKPVSVVNGGVWSDSETRLTVTDKYLIQSSINQDLGDNTKEGLLFTATFKTSAAPESWSLRVAYRALDIINSQSEAIPFAVVNTASSGYGAHSWDGGTVTVEPTVKSEGELLYRCIYCPAEKTEVLPMLERYKPGDIDNNGRVNIKDIFYIKNHIKGNVFLTGQAFDAGDINQDNKINILDLFEIKLIFKGIK